MANFRYSNKLKQISYMNVALLVIIVMLVGLCFNLLRSVDIAGQEQLLRIEPDLRVGTVRRVWEVPNPFVYSFALTLVQKVNTWQSDGSIDYPKNLMSLQNYITPSCRSFLTEDYEKKKKQGQLQNRSRVVMELSGIGFVDDGNTRLTSRGRWNVDLSLNVKEFIGNKLVKHIDVFWPVRVVEFNIDSELNTQGLALDCFSEQPKLIKDHRV
jgi:integrating conjugative element protein (TIGR03746 family)